MQHKQLDGIVRLFTFACDPQFYPQLSSDIPECQRWYLKIYLINLRSSMVSIYRDHALHWDLPTYSGNPILGCRGGLVTTDGVLKALGGPTEPAMQRGTVL